MNKTEYLKNWREKYRKDLTENILPFWLNHGIDRGNGGVYTCLDREGVIYDTTKSVWFQGRFAYILALAYNQIEAKEEYLTASKSCIDFIENFCFDADGRMFFEITADGKPLRKRRYIFSESFAAIAMSEYALASGENTYAQKAFDLFKKMQYWLETPGELESKFTENLKAKGHSITMIMLNLAAQIRKAYPHKDLDEQIQKSYQEITTDFMKPEFKAVLETVGEDGSFIDTMMGRLINPGHAIETGWFILEEAKFRNGDKDYIENAEKIINWSFDWGWDKDFGGILNFVDCKNYPAQDYAHDMKFWWPQTEAIIAYLYLYLATGKDEYLEKHQQISDWTYQHFPDRNHPEWFGYLHRDGSVSQPAKGNLFKGPFHIPRMMIKGVELCDLILKS